MASSKRPSTNMANASEFFARASSRRAPTWRNTAIASAWASTASCTRPTRRRSVPRARRTSARRRAGTRHAHGRVERAIARGERALHVAEVAQHLGHEQLRLDLEARRLSRSRDDLALLRQREPAREPALVEVEARRSNERDSHPVRSFALARERRSAARCGVARATALHASDRLERLVRREPARIEARRELDRAPVVARREHG